ncbi:hypothetical protein [Lihuaxuella thermophila]|uniref:Uncharacterized protein n=1 Tax=Lihuaxuella thermophila TaxID=1173111 RepID=A0A1H8F6J8_9BACL|nr:hypothetical protein [Lihuaxuella thermophila]SEN27166.1 hypothetical protein SAMN05444955_10832 [Lihuaxuella thermophila]
MKGSPLIGFFASLFLAFVSVVSFPEEALLRFSGRIWTYLSADYLLSFVCLLLSVSISARWLRKLISSFWELSASCKGKRRKWKIAGWIGAFTAIQIGCFLLLPWHAAAVFVVFAGRELRKWKAKQKQANTFSDRLTTDER